MKSTRSFAKLGFPALLFALVSCIDSSYDINNLDSEAVLFRNSLQAPVGRATITMDSIMHGINDTSFLKVVNGIYVLGVTETMDMSNITGSMSDFTLATPSTSQFYVNLFDAKLLPSSISLPYDLPTNSYTYTNYMNVALPDFSTSLMDVDSALLTNSSIRMTASSYDGLGGNDLSNSTILTFDTDGSDAADYYINNQKVTSWTVKMGESVTVEVRKIRLNTENDLKLKATAQVNVANPGDVQVTDRVQTKMNFAVDFPDGVDFSMVYGKVKKSFSGSIPNVAFDALGDMLGSSDILSIYNPTIKLITSSNLGVPIKLSLDMTTSNSTSGLTRSLSNNQFYMLASSSPQTDMTQTFTLDRANGTAELFKINPNQIAASYSVQTDTSTSNHFIAKDSRFSATCQVEIPLQFGSDLNLNIDNTELENPIGDEKTLEKLEDQDNLTVSLLMNIKNRIPLAMKIKLTALDKNGLELFNTSTGTIDAASPIDGTTGFATGYTATSTSIELTPTQINLLKTTSSFRVGFGITASPSSTFVTVQPTDYIELSIGAKVSGGVKIQLDPEDLF
jgi:hypothetical protein